MSDIQEDLQDEMREEYDFSNARKNPYAARLKQQKPQTTITIDTDLVDCFKEMSAELGVPYPKLIELCLKDCVVNKRQLDLSKI